MPFKWTVKCVYFVSCCRCCCYLQVAGVEKYRLRTTTDGLNRREYIYIYIERAFLNISVCVAIIYILEGDCQPYFYYMCNSKLNTKRKIKLNISGVKNFGNTVLFSNKFALYVITLVPFKTRFWSIGFVCNGLCASAKLQQIQ